MNTGFRHTLQDRLLGVTAHVNLSRPGAEGIADYRVLAQQLGRSPGVRSVAPAIYLTVLLSSGSRARGVVMKGVDPAMERASDEALQRVAAGTADFARDADGFDSVMIGRTLSQDLNIEPGRLRNLDQSRRTTHPFRVDAAFAEISSLGDL